MAKKIVRTLVDSKGNLVKYLVEGTDQWLTREVAIQKATSGEIDAVVVRPQKGLPYLRAKGNKNQVDNLQKIAIRPRRGIYSEWHFASGFAPPHSRPDPNAGWESKPRNLGDTIQARALWITTLAEPVSYMINLPNMSIFFNHWLGNSGQELSFNMGDFMAVSAAERDTVKEALRGAAEFAELNLKVGQSANAMTLSKPRPTGSLSVESTDWWNSVGGHTGYAKALLKKLSYTEFQMDLEYRLEDFFTFGGKGFFPGFHQWHLKGLAHDFLVNGVFTRIDLGWKLGEFESVLQDQ